LKATQDAYQANPFDDAFITKTLADETRNHRNLQDLRDEVEGAKAPSPTEADRSSIAAFQKYFTGYYGGILPEDEIDSSTRSQVPVR